MWMVEWSDAVPLDWKKHGDEWVSHLKRLLRESTKETAAGIDQRLIQDEHKCARRGGAIYSCRTRSSS
jgi:hypothetical protein